MTSPSIDKALQDALAQHRQGNLGAAMERYMKVLQEDVRNADANYYVAVVMMQDGQLEEGIKLAKRALSMEPPEGMPQARLHNLIGQALFRDGKLDDALKSFDRAIALKQDYADAHGNRANLLTEMGDFDRAMVGFDNALLLRQDSPEDWCNRGATLNWLNRTEEALKSFDRAIALRPNLAGAHFNCGNMLRDLGQMASAAGAPWAAQFDASEAAQSRAIELQPGFPDAHLGRGLARLLRGNWKDGWADYEYRSQVGSATFVPLKHSKWTGEAVQGTRLILVTEQGLGDTINFCRFAPLLAARGFDVTILSKPAMAPLLSTLPGVRIATSAEELAEDKRPIRWLPMMSLPGVLGIRPETIPAAVPYLAAAPERIEAWARRLGSGGFKIGVNWASGHSSDLHFKKRDIPLANFAALAAIPGVRLISLQKGPAVAEISQIAFRDRIAMVDADMDESADYFLDTAAVMMSLDLVITCDTSIAHLAGALARPAFVALPAVADWRWLLDRDDSPWYPTLKLFRQRKRGDWSDVFARIAQLVRALAGGASTQATH